MNNTLNPRKVKPLGFASSVAVADLPVQEDHIKYDPTNRDRLLSKPEYVKFVKVNMGSSVTVGGTGPNNDGVYDDDWTSD